MRVCFRCGYDLSGLRADPGADLVCPECSSLQRPEIERSHEVWQGWFRALRRTLLLPAGVWAVFVGMMLLGPLFNTLYDLLGIGMLLALAVGLLSATVSAAELTDLPRDRRPHAGFFAIVAIAINVLIGMSVLMIVAFSMQRAFD